VSNRTDADVLVVGGGPVGLSLATDLAKRGIRVTVVETRAAAEPPSVRCNQVSARTMEIFRRLGLAGAVRNAGLPADYPNDVVFRTTATGLELSHIPIPCRAERYARKDGPDGWWPTREPSHRVNQIFLEPVMFEHAARTSGLRILSRTSLIDFEQREGGVLAIAKNLETNESSEIFSPYLIGCDGAHSFVRRKLGIVLSGDNNISQAQSTYILAPRLLGLMPRPAWAIDCINPRSSGLVFAIDGRERWLVHYFLRPGETSSSADRERRIRDILGVDASFEFEILKQQDWTGRRMLADRFRDGRVFLCGDAAHIWVPVAGYGMNAGIAGAMNLSWMLAGVVKGWADPALLEAYEIERRPITQQVSYYAMDGLLARISQQNSAIPETIELPGPGGDAVRARIGRQAYDINVSGFCCAGLNFGYFYSDSPVIAYDGEQAPAYTIDDFSPSTVPGCRTPHLWLRDGRSLYDALGPDFTLLRFDPDVDVEPLVEAAIQCHVPTEVLDVDADDAAALYPHKLLLSRPDQHVAWRGDRPPDDPVALIDHLRGAPCRT
jgi:2-polyprenyl-6-methoxyphenol hydroxylase-like FAD-dependent oxidoreductase